MQIRPGGEGRYHRYGGDRPATDMGWRTFISGDANMVSSLDAVKFESERRAESQLSDKGRLSTGFKLSLCGSFGEHYFVTL